MQKDIIRVLNYFKIFSYSPSFKNIYIFLNKKSNRYILQKTLEKMISNKKISKSGDLYTLGEYNKGKLEIRNSKFEISQKKLNNWRFRVFVRLISIFLYIKLIGVSGSVAMNNAKENDDIDIFIIAKQNRLWTSRFLCVFVSLLLGIKRARIEPHTNDRVCLNLFIDEADLEMPKNKKNYYVAHEIIQMKPLVNKNYIYEQFLNKNKWVYEIFPNAGLTGHPGATVGSKRILNKQILSVVPRLTLGTPSRMTTIPPVIPAKAGIQAGFGNISNLIELMLKKVQKSIINRHKTTEIVTDTQLWFFPQDFEKKLPNWARKKYN
jgi:hypothetical protein